MVMEYGFMVYVLNYSHLLAETELKTQHAMYHIRSKH